MIHDLVIADMQTFDHINHVLQTYIAEALSQCEIAVHTQFFEPELKERASSF